MSIQLDSLGKLIFKIILLLVTLVYVGIFDYGLAGLGGLNYGIIVAILAAVYVFYFVRRLIGHNHALSASIMAALFTGISAGIGEIAPFIGVVFLFMGVGVGTGFIALVARNPRDMTRIETLRFGIGLSLLGFFYMITRIFLEYGFISAMEAILPTLVFWFFVAFFVWTCSSIGGIVGLILRPIVDEFPKIWRYLKAMGVALISFTLGYFTIAVVFASIFKSLFRLHVEYHIPQQPPFLLPRAEVPTFGEFFYFSLTAITTAGSSKIIPNPLWIRMLHSLEIILGIGWTLVIFSALIAYLEPKFNELRESEMGE